MQWKKSIAILVNVIFIFSVMFPQGLSAQNVLNLPPVGQMIMPTQPFMPAMLKGIKLFPENPLKFDFIIDTGNADFAKSSQEKKFFREESKKLIKYFLASLTIAEEDMWVNLSPHEPDRIIPKDFGVTAMGCDLLSQDYILKQLTASLIYPEEAIGETFWQRVYDKAYDLYGANDIPVNTFNKVWIVPEKAVVYENAQSNSVFVIESKLKVMLEEDYHSYRQKDAIKHSKENSIASEIIRKLIIPEIEKEVNQGKNFAQLRQIYHTMILATWFKQNLNKSLLGNIYVDKNKIEGVAVNDRDIKNKIYHQYLEAFKKGVYSYIKEDYDPVRGKIIPRKYFSGGISTNLASDEILETMKGKSVNVRMLAKAFKAAVGVLLISVVLSCANQRVIDEDIDSQKIETSANGFIENTEFFIQATSDSDFDVREKAVAALGALEHKSEEVIAVLIVAMNDLSLGVREKAVLGLSSLENKSREVIIALLRAVSDSDSDVRFQATKALVAMENKSKEVVDVLLLAVEDVSDDVREQAVKSLGTLENPSKEVMDALHLAATDESARVRFQAIKALGASENQSDETIALLFVALHDGSPQVRDESARLLEKLFKGDVESLYAKTMLKLIKSDRVNFNTKLKIIDRLLERGLWIPLKEARMDLEELYRMNPGEAEIVGKILVAMVAEENFKLKSFVSKKINKQPVNNTKDLIREATNILFVLKDAVSLEDEQSIAILKKIILQAEVSASSEVSPDAEYTFGIKYMDKILKHFGHDTFLATLLILAHETIHNILHGIGLSYENLDERSIHEFVCDFGFDIYLRHVGRKDFISKIDAFFLKDVSFKGASFSDRYAVSRIQRLRIREAVKQKGWDLDGGEMLRLSIEIIKEKLEEKKRTGVEIKFLGFIEELMKRYGEEMKKKGYASSKTKVPALGTRSEDSTSSQPDPTIKPYQPNELLFFLGMMGLLSRRHADESLRKVLEEIYLDSVEDEMKDFRNQHSWGTHLYYLKGLMGGGSEKARGILTRLSNYYDQKISRDKKSDSKISQLVENIKIEIVDILKEDVRHKNQKALSEPKKSTTDSAMVAEELSVDKHTKGGIDLNSSQLKIESKGEKIKDFSFPFNETGIPCIDEDGDGVCDAIDVEALEKMDIRGFTPIIFQIETIPTSNLPLFFGLIDENEYFEHVKEHPFYYFS